MIVEISPMHTYSSAMLGEELDSKELRLKVYRGHYEAGDMFVINDKIKIQLAQAHLDCGFWELVGVIV